MVRKKKLLVALVLVIMALLAPMSALAGTRVTNGYTLTFPDDMVSCKPVFNFTLEGASPTAQVSFVVSRVDLGTGDMILYPAVDMTYSSGVFVGSFTTSLSSGIYSFGAGFTITDTDANGVTFKKSVATFKWEVTCQETPPPDGGEGCTPGYWKQPQHLDSWVGYSPSELYNDVFGVNFNSGLTLLQALGLNGGGANALARHSTAALLNASSPSVDYDFTTTQIIEAVQAAFANGNYEGLKDVFEGYNEQGCPLN